MRTGTRATGLRPLGLMLVALTLAGCASTAGTTAEAPSASGPDLEALEAAYWARQVTERERFTPADVEFMIGMIGHHAQALVMAALAPTNGASPAVQRLAARIDNSQRDEIATMQRWLRDRDQPVPTYRFEGTRLSIEMEGAAMDHGGMDHGSGEMNHEGMDHGDGAHGMSHGGMDHAGMPGMLSQAQLDELAAAQGEAFDRLFLAYMIQHHAGAVTMVETLVATDGAAQDEQAFKFASDVQVDQRTEIARMQQMLDALSDS